MLASSSSRHGMQAQGGTPQGRGRRTGVHPRANLVSAGRLPRAEFVAACCRAAAAPTRPLRLRVLPPACRGPAAAACRQRAAAAAADGGPGRGGGGRRAQLPGASRAGRGVDARARRAVQTLRAGGGGAAPAAHAGAAAHGSVPARGRRAPAASSRRCSPIRNLAPMPFGTTACLRFLSKNPPPVSIPSALLWPRRVPTCPSMPCPAPPVALLADSCPPLTRPVAACPHWCRRMPSPRATAMTRSRPTAGRWRPPLPGGARWSCRWGLGLQQADTDRDRGNLGHLGLLPPLPPPAAARAT